MSEYYDIEKIKEFLSLTKPNNELYEVRILLKNKRTLSGYFKGTDNLEEQLKKVDLRGANIFCTLNKIDEACYSRDQNERFRDGATTTADNDIIGYNWMLVDIDPKRRTGVSSSEAELGYAKEVAQRITWFMKHSYFNDPIIALSGNGVHLMYPIELRNTDENKELIKKCLEALALLFNNEHVEIDCKVFNPGRISKLYGTLAQKGANTKERPHRMSRVVRVPYEIRPTDITVLLTLADTIPKEEQKPAVKKSKAAEFDLDDWIRAHGINVTKTSEWNGCRKYVLKECAFDPSHKAPDSCLLKMPSGAIAYKCLHNSCSGRTWHDFRLLYEPDAYSKEYEEDDGHIDKGWAEYKNYNRNRTDINYNPEIFKVNEPMFLTPLQILSMPKEDKVYVKSGIDELDHQLGGLVKREISLFSGLRGSGKSTLLSQLALKIIDQGYTVMIYSGELKSDRLMDWMFAQAAGLHYIVKSKKYDNYFFVRDEIKRKIADWIQDKLVIYNNDHGNDFKSIATNLRKYMDEHKVDFVIIDNMMCLNLSGMAPNYRNDKYEEQTSFVGMLKNIAMECNVGVLFVAHPRKAQGFLRLDDVAGSGNISNLVDNAFIVHRNNEDFRRLTKQMYHWKDNHQVYQGNNVMEICKNRENGVQDKFIPLWYEMGTRRFFNHAGEELRFTWELTENGIFVPLNDDADVDIPFTDV